MVKINLLLEIYEGVKMDPILGAILVIFAIIFIFYLMYTIDKKSCQLMLVLTAIIVASMVLFSVIAVYLINNVIVIIFLTIIYSLFIVTICIKYGYKKTPKEKLIHKNTKFVFRNSNIDINKILANLYHWIKANGYPTEVVK